jgi:hypothetical protein
LIGGGTALAIPKNYFYSFFKIPAIQELNTSLVNDEYKELLTEIKLKKNDRILLVGNPTVTNDVPKIGIAPTLLQNTAAPKMIFPGSFNTLIPLPVERGALYCSRFFNQIKKNDENFYLIISDNILKNQSEHKRIEQLLSPTYLRQKEMTYKSWHVFSLIPKN